MIDIEHLMELRMSETDVRLTDENKHQQTIPISEDRKVHELFKTLYQEKLPADTPQVNEFGYLWGGHRWRGTMYHHQGGWSIRLRIMPKKISTFDQLSFEYEAVMRLVRGEGLTIFAGPTGAGKSTTMLAAMDALRNLGQLGDTVTIEDPVEYLHESDEIEQRAVGEDTASFDRGIVEAMRFTPRTIVIGEIRDGASADAAIQAGLTGHRVLATLHANNTFDVLNRLKSRLSSEQRGLMATALQGIMVQRLEVRPNGPPIPVYETLFVDNRVRNNLDDETGSMAQINHDFTHQGYPRMEQMRQELVDQGIIVA